LKSLEVWIASSTLVLLPLVVWIQRGRAWAFGLLGVVAIFWCLLSGIAAFRLTSPALGFFTASLIAFWALILSWVRFEMTKSFFELPMRWFQGHPQAVPGADCRISFVGSEMPEIRARISRIDEEGLCIHANGIFRLRAADEAEMILSYREREVRCQASAMTIAQEGRGGALKTIAGFRFRGMAPDARKELGDFVEYLRGEGHA